ncbi:pilus assembly protein TadG-related protein [Cryobacterium tepidiphilum]|nr:pilus assembly protein TadG-related protein [Cryobacterium tepidiphilum]
MMVALLMVPLVGFAAIAVDAGALYAEKAQLQNGADAAALAVAQHCAVDACGDTASTAEDFASANANDGAANVFNIELGSNTVTVSDSTRTAQGSGAMSHPLAALIGVNSSTVHATATAEWGGPGSGPAVLPIALSYCEVINALEPGVAMTIRTDTNRPCHRAAGEPEIPGGFGWIDQIDGSCESYVDVTNGELWVGSDPGNNVPTLCKDKLDELKGQTILIPVYDGARGNGQNAEYRIYAFAAFTITGWNFSGFSDTDPAASPSCTGNCRAIQGYFQKWVSVDSAFDLGGPDLGGSVVRLID